MSEIEQRKTKINEFLKYLSEILEQNPTYFFNDKAIYSLLIHLGVNPEENQKGKVRENFDYWQSRNSMNPDLKCFVSDNWPYFCQFISNDNYDKDNHLKTYIPLDASHIREGANIIFDFLTNNHIPHLSKIGSDVRFDDIVVRLYREEDVIKLTNFVKNNQYLQEGLISPNPFLRNENGVALTCDGVLSCNSTLSTFICDYINNKKVNRKLYSVSVDDFYVYLKEKYCAYFINKRDMQEIEHLFSIEKDNIVEVTSLKGVMEILISSNEEKYDLNKYFNIYNKMNSDMGIAPIIENDYHELNEKEINQLLLEGLKILSEKYGDKTAIVNLKGYYLSGNLSYITREADLRRRYANVNFNEVLKKYLYTKNISFDSYISSLVSMINHQDEKSAKIEIKDLVAYIKFIYEVMLRKYGEEIAVFNVTEYLKNGDESLLTRDYNIRTTAVTSNIKEKLNDYLKKNNLDFNAFMNNLLTNKNQKNYLEDAIQTTFDKYDLEWTVKALSSTVEYALAGENLIKNNLGPYSYGGFTRDNNARGNLIKFLTPADIKKIIMTEMNLEVLNESELENVCTEYISLITSRDIKI